MVLWNSGDRHRERKASFRIKRHGDQEDEEEIKQKSPRKRSMGLHSQRLL